MEDNNFEILFIGVLFVFDMFKSWYLMCSDKITN